MAVSHNTVLKKCRQAGISFWTSSQAAIALKDKLSEKISDRELNRKIINELKLIDSNAAEQYESYHSIEVRTSKNVFETFERRKIARSLIKETRLPKAIAEEIAYSVENEIRRLQLKSISAALVREMVNAALIERKLFTAQANYTRVGLPVNDIKMIIEGRKVQSPAMLNEIFGNAVLQEFTLHKLLSRNISEAYLNSDIHIHALENFGTSPYTIQNDLRTFLKSGFALPKSVTTGPAKKPDVAAYHAVRILINSKRYTARGVGFDFFNIFMAPYLKGKTKKETAQVCQSFLYELNSHPALENMFTINFDTAIPKFLKDEPAIGPSGKTVGCYGDYEKESSDFMKVFLEMMQRGDNASNPFKFPNICIKHTGKVDEDLHFPRPCYFINQTDKNQSLLYNNVLTGRDTSTMRAGVMQAVSINLPKIAKLNKDEKLFYEAIESTLDITKEVMLQKREIIKERLYKNEMLSLLAQFHDNEEYIKLSEFRYQVLLSGLPQACKIYLGKERYDKDCLDLSKRIIRFMQRKFREYKKDSDLQFTAGEHAGINALTRFTTENKRLGIEQDISGITSEGLEEDEVIEMYKQTQPLLDGGSFYETNSKNLIKDREFLFLKTF